MTSLFLFIRHASHEALGHRLLGRADDPGLSALGRAEAMALAETLRRDGPARVLTSPRRRTLETAAVIAATAGLLPPERDDRLDEIELGSWSGKSFDALAADPVWRAWNVGRSLLRPPGGESIPEVQVRVLGLIEALRAAADDQPVVLVTHAEPIRAAVLYALGMPVDFWGRITVDPASITRIAVEGDTPRLVTLNERPAQWGEGPT